MKHHTSSSCQNTRKSVSGMLVVAAGLSLGSFKKKDAQPIIKKKKKWKGKERNNMKLW